MAKPTGLIVPLERVEARILLIRDEKVILDSDLAELYGVQTKVLNQAVRRNLDRFPPDFMLRLSKEEFQNLGSQFVTSRWGGRRYTPYAFTEHGAIMAASVLNSDRAVQVSIYVVRAFVKLRQALSAHKELAKELAQLEKKLQTHDKQIGALVIAMRELMPVPKAKPQKRIGYLSELESHHEKLKKARRK